MTDSYDHTRQQLEKLSEQQQEIASLVHRLIPLAKLATAYLEVYVDPKGGAFPWCVGVFVEAESYIYSLSKWQPAPIPATLAEAAMRLDALNALRPADTQPTG